MAHFARLDEYNNVVEVVVVNNDVITIDGIESEQAGIDFLVELTGYNRWIQTSYNANIRKNYAGIGYKYNPELDAFIPPKPFGSWLLNDFTCLWEAPIPYPSDGKDYIWNEANKEWVKEVLLTE